jgi:hypothetical protein
MTKTIEEIVNELAADIRARAPTRFSADYSSTDDFKVGALISSWRERGEALKPFAKDADIYHDADDTMISVIAASELMVGDLRRARAALTGEGLIAELEDGDKPPLEPQTDAAGYEP